MSSLLSTGSSALLAFQRALATVSHNVANVNTPGYRLRDLSQTEFQERLKEAIASSQSGGETLSPGLSQSDPGDPMRSVRAST